jgi:hypothetical protein
LPDGILPRVEIVQPPTSKEIEEIRAMAGLVAEVSIKGSVITSSSAGNLGTRKRGS